MLVLNLLSFFFVGLALITQIANQNIGDHETAILTIGWLLGTGVAIAGNLSMKKLKNYPLSLAGSIISIFTGFSCCFLPVIFGIWGIVILCDGNVKRAFRR